MTVSEAIQKLQELQNKGHGNSEIVFLDYEYSTVHSVIDFKKIEDIREFSPYSEFYKHLISQNLSPKTTITCNG
jgi:hypothetical protein